MKKNAFLVLFLMVFYNFISAQSADSVTELLNSRDVNLLQVSYFATVYLGLSTDEISYNDAVTVLDEYIKFPKIKNSQNPRDALTYEELSYFCTRVWNIKGGMMYRITKSPRYALRELKSLGYVSSNIDPNILVPGRDALTIMTKCAEYAETKNTLETIVLPNVVAEENQNIEENAEILEIQ